MSDVIAFLRARLDDDEKIANTAIGRQPEYAEWAYEGDEVFAPGLSEPGDRWNVTCDSEGLRPAVVEKDGPHIAHYDPARALRDVAAKRLIIEVELRNLEAIDGEWGCGCTADEIRAGKCAGRGRSESKTFRGLAAVYSDHPDYRKEWQI